MPLPRRRSRYDRQSGKPGYPKRSVDDDFLPIHDHSDATKGGSDLPLFPKKAADETITGSWTFDGAVTFGGTPTFNSSPIFNNPNFAINTTEDSFTWDIQLDSDGDGNGNTLNELIWAGASNVATQWVFPDNSGGSATGTLVTVDATPASGELPLAGSLIYGGGVNTSMAKLALSGTATHALFSNGSTAPEWRAITEADISDLSHTTDHGALSGLTDDDHTQYLLANGNRSLTGDWDAGSGKISTEIMGTDVITEYSAGVGVTIDGLLIKDGAIDHGALSGLSDDDHTQYIRHALVTAANDFLVASGSGVVVKKTLAETGAILEADIDHGNIQGLADDDHTQYAKSTPAAGRGKHTLLDGGTWHTDTASGVATRGNIIVGDSAGEWGDLSKASSVNHFLGTDGTDTVFRVIPATAVPVHSNTYHNTSTQEVFFPSPGGNTGNYRFTGGAYSSYWGSAPQIQPVTVYPDAVVSNAHWGFQIPTDYVSGGSWYVWVSSHTGTATQDNRWIMYAHSCADSGENPKTSSDITAVAIHPYPTNATQEKYLIGTDSTNLAAGEYCLCACTRDGVHALDTLTSYALVAGWSFEYTSSIPG